MIGLTPKQAERDDTIAALDAEIAWLAGLAAKRDAERGVDRCAGCMERLCGCNDFDWKAGQGKDA